MTYMGNPRRHHYVPRSYLAGFTQTGKKDGRLCVLDKSDGRSWHSNPRDSACKRDLYAPEDLGGGGGVDAQEIEQTFGIIEGAYTQAIGAVLESGIMPISGDSRENLMLFLAAQHTRVPGVTEVLDDVTNRLMSAAASFMTATPETWADHADGSPGSDIPYERVRALVQSGECQWELGQNERLAMQLGFVEPIAKALDKRQWSVVHAVDRAPDFMTSDRPLSVSWTHPQKHADYAPGIGLSQTTVMFPISKRVALLGMFEGVLPTKEATSAMVGIVNMWTGLSATKYVFSAAQDFQVTLPDLRMGGREEFLAIVRGGRSAQETK